MILWGKGMCLVGLSRTFSLRAALLEDANRAQSQVLHPQPVAQSCLPTALPTGNIPYILLQGTIASFRALGFGLWGQWRSNCKCAEHYIQTDV